MRARVWFAVTVSQCHASVRNDWFVCARAGTHTRTHNIPKYYNSVETNPYFVPNELLNPKCSGIYWVFLFLSFFWELICNPRFSNRNLWICTHLYIRVQICGCYCKHGPPQNTKLTSCPNLQTIVYICALHYVLSCFCLIFWLSEYSIVHSILATEKKQAYIYMIFALMDNVKIC